MIVHRRVMMRSQKFHGGTLDADAAFSPEFHDGTHGRMIIHRRVMMRSQKFHGGTLDAVPLSRLSSTVELMTE